MKWFQIPMLVVILMPGCSLMVENDAFFEGAANRAGAAGARISDAPADAGSGGMSGWVEVAGASSEAAGASSAAAGAASAAAGAAGSPDLCNLPPTAEQSEPCGPCGVGMRARTLQLMADCTYAVGEWSGCEGQAACNPGQVDTAQQACGACETGKQTRTRTCSSDTCVWSAWSAWSACGGVTAACAPGQTTTCTNGDSCGQRVCSSSCAWGACTPKVAGGCVRIGPGHTDEGSNYHCCGNGKWAFCLSTCHWSTTCEACTDCGC